MNGEIYIEQDFKINVRHVNALTRIIFKNMLNKLGPSVEIGESNLKYGDVLFQNDAENFESLFNKFCIPDF